MRAAFSPTRTSSPGEKGNRMRRQGFPLPFFLQSPLRTVTMEAGGYLKRLKTAGVSWERLNKGEIV